MKTLMIRLALVVALAPLSACFGHHDDSPPLQVDAGPVGGGCEYEEFPGICTIDDGDQLVFQGNVAGSEVLSTNSVDSVEDIVWAGTPVPCALRCATRGTCGPCGLQVNMSQEYYNCGPTSWDACRVFWSQED